MYVLQLRNKQKNNRKSVRVALHKKEFRFWKNPKSSEKNAFFPNNEHE